MTSPNAWTPRIVGDASEHPDDVAGGTPADGIETVQLLDAEGGAVRHPTYSPQLSADEVRDAYRTMFLALQVGALDVDAPRQEHRAVRVADLVGRELRAVRGVADFAAFGIQQLYGLDAVGRHAASCIIRVLVGVADDSGGPSVRRGHASPFLRLRRLRFRSLAG